MTVASPLSPTERVPLAETEQALERLLAAGGSTRACSFTLILYLPAEEQQLLSALGWYAGPIDAVAGDETRAALSRAQAALGLPVTGQADEATLVALRQSLAARDGARASLDRRSAVFTERIARQHPCRLILICPQLLGSAEITAEVSAYRPVEDGDRDGLLYCETIVLRGREESFRSAGPELLRLMRPGLPLYLYWEADADPQHPLLTSLLPHCQLLMVDSATLAAPAREFRRYRELQDQGATLADLNWLRLAAWQELTAAAYDPPERRLGLSAIDRVAIDYERGNNGLALLFLGWLAGRLGWEPRWQQRLGGDYDLRRFGLDGPEGRQVEAELGSLPVGESGDVVGELVGIRLTSTNPEIDCGTLLCSETTGCMHMETGGRAQQIYTETVSPEHDRTSEELLARQLQQPTGDPLYAETLAVTVSLIETANG